MNHPGGKTTNYDAKQRCKYGCSWFFGVCWDSGLFISNSITRDGRHLYTLWKVWTRYVGLFSDQRFPGMVGRERQKQWQRWFSWWSIRTWCGGAVGSFNRGRGALIGRAHSAQLTQITEPAPVAQAVASSVASPVANLAQHREYDRNAIPQLSDDQWTAVVKFLNNQKSQPVDNLTGKTDNDKFIIDTGASHHMTWNMDLLCNVIDIFPRLIGLPDGDNALATKQGDLCLGGDLWLCGVLYSPELTCSLMLVAKLLKAIKGSITFTEDLCVLQDRTSKDADWSSEECGGVYVFRGIFSAQAHKAASSSGRDLWYRRLGHPNYKILSFLSSHVDVGKPADNGVVCDICFRAKQTRNYFYESFNKAVDLFDLIHCDVWGPYRTLSSSGASYFLTIVDDSSRAVWVYLLQEKREVAASLQKICAMVSRQFNKDVRVVRSDNGSEFMCLKPFFEKEGIFHQTSCVARLSKMGMWNVSIDTY